MSLSKKITSEASDWYLQLTSGEATQSDFNDWQSWILADKDHQVAWDQIKAATLPFSNIDKSLRVAASNVVKQESDSKFVARRNALKQLGALFVMTTTGVITYELKPWQNLLADYKTSFGEQKEFELDDGTKLHLNTDSLVAINFNDEYRTLTLYRGEVMIETGHTTPETHRPFRVNTSQGTITALGTRFTVRQHDEFTSVNLLEGELNIQPHLGSTSMRLKAGEHLSFSEKTSLRKSTINPNANAWLTGYIVADKMTLAEFADELSRYRQGGIQCDRSVQGLIISGAYPIKNIDAVLTTLTEQLPVRIEHFTRFYTSIRPI